ATHVAGTLIGTGLDPDAQGMSWEGVLSAHDWSYDEPEMATAAAAGMNVSNHSYGYATGWRSSGGNWYWYGDPAIDPVEDWSFGFYSSSSVLWDEIAFDAPYYLICKSAGNDRNDDGPGAGGTHYVWSGGSWVTSNDTRDPDGGADGYDCLPTKGTAKNILTVGAVDDIPGGYTAPPDVSMTSFSGWGPTDDGRIKPDLVANGNSLYSCLSSGDSAYGTKTGTSMSSPNAAGSANLLVRHYADTHAALLPTAAAIKALLIHSADEAGADPGPDYAHGWGLMNTRSAADLITEDASSGGESRIVHASLADGAEDLYSFTLAAAADFRATIVWTDPPGTPVANALDPPDAMLVNDLDLALETTSGALLASPWILDPADPAAPASTGDNTVDNVEQVFAPGLSAGDYALRVSHKSSLDGGLQDYALVSSAPLVAGGAQTGAAERVAADGVAAATPNPFARETVIRFTRKAGVEARITLYDIAGREVRTLRADAGEAGAHAIRWDGRNARGRTLPAGLYFAKIRAGHRNTTVKLTLLGRD
ncbi:MAG: S8 family serine peptidase, partial [Gemmatimonadota bacterium]|nr:S8 family serine peptidase [Gemmatimonadota bacterium]